VPGVLYHLAGRSPLHDPPGVHHRDGVGEVAGGGDVVGDVQHGELMLVRELAQQVQQAGPDGDVEHGDGLVGEQHLRPDRQGEGDRHALSFAARQLVRELGQEFPGWTEFHLLEQADGLRPHLRSGPGVVMQPQRPRQVVGDGVGRVE